MRMRPFRPLAAVAISVMAALPASAVQPDIVAIEAGAYHTCAIVRGGDVRCWGWNDWAQLGDGTTISRSTPALPVLGVSDAAAVVSGGRHNCALITDSSVQCWGANDYGQLGNAAAPEHASAPVQVQGLHGVTALAAGNDYTCAVVPNGEVRCWGFNWYGELGDGSTNGGFLEPVPVVGVTGATAIAAGTYHTCAIVPNGEVRCWGAGHSGQRGDGGATGIVSDFGFGWQPTPVVGVVGATSITAGDTHTCAIAAEGRVYCWGSDAYGQRGPGTGVWNFAHEIAGVSGATALASSGVVTCALVSGGELKCWGSNTSGQLGSDEWYPPRIVTVPGVRARAVATGWAHTCAALIAGGVRCWGEDYHGQLGLGRQVDTTMPVRAQGLPDSRALSAGTNHTCAIGAAGDVRCWGSNFYGQIGDGGPLTRRATPAAPAATDAVAVDSSFDRTCAIVGDGRVRCWGGGHDPIGEQAIVGATAVTTGGAFMCALVDGGVRCWGSGWLGDGSYYSQTGPVQVAGLSDVSVVSAGAGHACAVVTGGDVYCWGDNSSGEVGDGSRSERPTPVKVSGLESAVDIAAGTGFTCAVTSSGRVWCWGQGAPGHDFDTPLVPQPVAGIESAKAIGADRDPFGQSHLCAIVASGAIECWGFGWRGELGAGGSLWTLTPVRVAGLSGATAIALGEYHTCAVAQGETWCWGESYSGQLGDAVFRGSPSDVIWT